MRFLPLGKTDADVCKRVVADDIDGVYKREHSSIRYRKNGNSFSRLPPDSRDVVILSNGPTFSHYTWVEP